MRKDIRAINEAYMQATAPKRTLSELVKLHGDRLHIQPHTATEVNGQVGDTEVEFAFKILPGSEGDYDTPGEYAELEPYGAFLDDQPVEVPEEDMYEAKVAAYNELGLRMD